MPGRFDRNHDHRDAAVSGRTGIGSHTEPFMRGTVCDAVPDLGSGDDPFVAVLHRPGAQTGQIGARFGFGVADRADQFAASYRRKELGLVLFGAVPHDHRRHRGHGEIRAGDAPVLELAHQQVLIGRRRVPDRRTPAASSARTIPARRSCAGTTRLPRRETLGRVRPVRTSAPGVTFALQKVTHLRQPGVLRCVEFEIHHPLPSAFSLLAPGISKRNIKYYDVPIDDPQSASAPGSGQADRKDA